MVRTSTGDSSEFITPSRSAEAPVSRTGVVPSSERSVAVLPLDTSYCRLQTPSRAIR